MRLIKLEIVAFGRLQGCTLDFAPGLTIFHGANEWGKSTILACLKAMFYGFTGNARSIRENERRRYLPWDGSHLAANLIFEHQNVRYRLERSFGKTRTGDRLCLMQDVTGQIVPLASQQEVGEYLLQMTADEFVHSVFVGQLASPLGSPDHSTLTKLTNLAGSGDENLSHQQVDASLREAQARLKAEKGSGGRLHDWNRQLLELTLERQDAIGLESEQARRLLALAHWQARQQQAATDLEKARTDLETGKAAVNQQRWQQVQQRKYWLDAAEAQYDRLQRGLQYATYVHAGQAAEIAGHLQQLLPEQLVATRPVMLDFTCELDAAFVEKGRQAIQAWQEAARNLAEQIAQSSRYQEQLTRLEEQLQCTAKLDQVDRKQLSLVLNEIPQLREQVQGRREQLALERQALLQQWVQQHQATREDAVGLVRQAVDAYEKLRQQAEGLDSDDRSYDSQIREQKADLERFIQTMTAQQGKMAEELAAAEADLAQRQTEAADLANGLAEFDRPDPAVDSGSAAAAGSRGESAGGTLAGVSMGSVAGRESNPAVSRPGHQSGVIGLILGLVLLVAGIVLGLWIHPIGYTLAGAGFVVILLHFLQSRLNSKSAGSADGYQPVDRTGTLNTADRTATASNAGQTRDREPADQSQVLALAVQLRQAQQQARQAQLDAANRLVRTAGQHLQSLIARQQAANQDLQAELELREERLAVLEDQRARTRSQIAAQAERLAAAEAALGQAREHWQIVRQIPSPVLEAGVDRQLADLEQQLQQYQQQLTAWLDLTQCDDMQTLQLRLGQRDALISQVDDQRQSWQAAWQRAAAAQAHESMIRYQTVAFYGPLALHRQAIQNLIDQAGQPASTAGPAAGMMGHGAGDHEAGDHDAGNDGGQGNGTLFTAGHEPGNPDSRYFAGSGEFDWLSAIWEITDQAEIEDGLRRLGLLISVAQVAAERVHQARSHLATMLGDEDWETFNERWKNQQSGAPDPSLQFAHHPLDLDNCQRTVQASQQVLNDIRIEIARLETAIRHAAQPRLPVVEFDQTILALQAKIAAAQQYYDGLTLARTLFQEAFAELQASFGPRLNACAARNLAGLTGQRYTELKIDRSFAVKLISPQDPVFREWEYFSGGTVDQIYLALRLAVAEITSRPAGRMPLLLDDVFIQYDDQRTRAGLQWLQGLVRQENWQALLFTCHERVVSMAAELDGPVVIRSLADACLVSSNMETPPNDPTSRSLADSSPRL